MKEVEWSVVALVVGLLLSGVMLYWMHEPEQGKTVIAVALGLLVGLPIGWRRRGQRDSERPGPMLIPVLVAFGAAVLVSGCGGGSQASRSVCSVARAAVNAAHEVVENRCSQVPQ